MEYNRINKIHYCWFGKTPKPELVKRCINSWHKYFDDFEIIEWNEDNFDLHENYYCWQAYEKKKYAFVSDYVRISVLYRYGGLYLDTDVEIIKDFHDLLNNKAFVGFEYSNYVNPGLVIWVNPQNAILNEMLQLYDKLKFVNSDGNINSTTICQYFTDILFGHGLICDGSMQICGDFTIYPRTYFCPTDGFSKFTEFTDSTRTIHHYMGSWVNNKDLKSKFRRLYGILVLSITRLFPYLDRFRRSNNKNKQL